MSININFDADEGRFVTICCLACQGETEVATLYIARPFRMYIASIDCEDCGESIVEYDIKSHTVIEEKESDEEIAIRLKFRPQSLSAYLKEKI